MIRNKNTLTNQNVMKIAAIVEKCKNKFQAYAVNMIYYLLLTDNHNLYYSTYCQYMPILAKYIAYVV